MNALIRPDARRALAFACAVALASTPLPAANFNYHGQLLDGDAPASGRYDLRLRTLAQPDAKAAIADAVEMSNVTVVDGSFAIELDLAESKIGDTWVEVAVRKADSNDAYEVLGAPQKLSKANNGCWALDGNTGLPAGSFLGNADPASTAALALRARNSNVAVFTPLGTASNHGDAPSVRLGSSVNVASAVGATVGGGGSTLLSGGAACPTCNNRATGEFSTVAGGKDNEAIYFSTVSGGTGNRGSGAYSTVAGGDHNEADGNNTTVSGGIFNRAYDFAGTISGGSSNYSDGRYSTIPGGKHNVAGSDYSFAAGNGARVRISGVAPGMLPFPLEAADFTGNSSTDAGSFVWADSIDGSTTVPFRSSGTNQFLIRANGGLGLNTSRMGAAPDLRSGEIVVNNSSSDPNTDITLLNTTNRGFGLVSEPGTGGNAGRFYITEVNATAPGVLFDPKLRINVDGTTSVVGGAVTNISDARVKKNIAAIDKPLETLLALQGHTFEYIDPAASMNPPGTRIGFVAQEVREVLPQWISDVGNGRLGVQTSGFEALAVEAIRDLKARADARISALETGNAALQTQNEELRAELDAVIARLSHLEQTREN